MRFALFECFLTMVIYLICIHTLCNDYDQTDSIIMFEMCDAQYD